MKHLEKIALDGSIADQNTWIHTYALHKYGDDLNILLFTSFVDFDYTTTYTCLLLFNFAYTNRIT